MWEVFRQVTQEGCMIGNHRDKREGKREVGAHTRPIGNLGMGNENGPYQGHCGRAVGK